MNLGIGQIVDGIVRQAEKTVDGVSETLFEPVIRLGVTGLSRSGKTVFITALVARQRAEYFRPICNRSPMT